MKTFSIEIQELLSRVIDVEAENINEATSKIRKMYEMEEIVLDWADHVTTEIKKFKDE